MIFEVKGRSLGEIDSRTCSELREQLRLAVHMEASPFNKERGSEARLFSTKFLGSVEKPFAGACKRH